MEFKPKAVIIGAGIAGIASAIRLAVKGFEVRVFEANGSVGGKLSEVFGNGFRFDAGPSLFTMPQYVDELFALAGEDPRKFFRYQKLELICRYFYEGGTEINAWADTGKLASEIAAKTADSRESVKKFLAKSARIYDLTHQVFLERSLHKLSGYLNIKTLNSILHFCEIDPLRSMNKANSSFFCDSKTIRFFNRYATYNGSNPYQAPATLNIIPHFEYHFGAYFPSDGMFSIAESLFKLAERLDVNVSFNSKVEEIICKNRQVKGIKVNNTFVPADVVISNADIRFTYQSLLKDILKPPALLKQEPSSSALVFYWGMNKTFPRLDLHNIFFSENYEEEFDCIWKKKNISKDPTIYINISSKYKPDDAPAGCENWFVMINVPSDQGQDWKKLISAARKNILSKLERNLKTSLEEHIIFEKILEPSEIQRRTGSFQGALYGNSSNSRMAAFLRHANFSSKIKGLYFAGGSVHPGGGIPLALLSAKIAVQFVKI